MKKQRVITAVEPISNIDGRTTYRPVRTEKPGALLSQDDAMNAIPAIPVSETVTGTHANRAVAFLIKTSFFGVLVGIMFWIVVGGLIKNYPLLSLAAAAYFFTGFVTAYVIAFVLDALLSPAGVALYQARQYWRIMRDEAEWRRRQ